jgi:ATP-dependent 26S proteasome regulatory subunit
MLFGVFAVHSPELCPLNNKSSKKIFLEIQGKLKSTKKKFNIQKILGFYMSVLEHEWIIVMDAKSAHDIEQMCIEVGISAISTVKIVPMNDFRKAVIRLKST